MAIFGGKGMGKGKGPDIEIEIGDGPKPGMETEGDGDPREMAVEDLFSALDSRDKTAFLAAWDRLSMEPDLGAMAED